MPIQCSLHNFVMKIMQFHSYPPIHKIIIMHLPLAFNLQLSNYCNTYEKQLFIITLSIILLSHK